MTPREAPRRPRGERTTTLGRKLTAARLRAGLTQEALAERLGVPVSSVGNWESGRTTPLRMYRRAIEAFVAEHPPKPRS